MESKYWISGTDDCGWLVWFVNYRGEKSIMERFNTKDEAVSHKRYMENMDRIDNGR